MTKQPWSDVVMSGFYWSDGQLRKVKAMPRYKVGDTVFDKRGNQYTVEELLAYQYRWHSPEPYYRVTGGRGIFDYNLW